MIRKPVILNAGIYDCFHEGHQNLLREMNVRVEEIERLVLELKALGAGVPVVEKNAQSILSFVNVLKFGISDVAEIKGNQGGHEWEK